jgi:hypothetical protein
MPSGKDGKKLVDETEIEKESSHVMEHYGNDIDMYQRELEC